MHSPERIAELEQALAERELQLKRLQDELLEAGKFSLVGQIAAEAAHDINNPLSSIRVHVEELIRDLKMGQFQASDAEESLKIINHNVQRVTNAVQGLREIARGPSGNFTQIDLNQVLHQSAQTLRKPLEKEGIFLDEGYNSTPLEFFANSNKLDELISNLVINARDAILLKKIESPKIVIRSFIDVDGVGFEVQDNGGGVAPELREKIFAPFFTTKPKGQGVGLGLAIVKRIADEHRASIELQSDATGSTFRLRFPKDRRIVARSAPQ